MTQVNWWNPHYPFRRQLTFKVDGNGIAAPQRGFVVIPEEWFTDNILIEDPYNFAIVYQHQNIAKPVYIDMRDVGTTISFQMLTNESPNSTSDKYWLYYGVSEDNAITQPIPTYIVGAIYDENVAYTGPDHWQVTPGEIPTPWNDYLTYTPGARLSLSAPASIIEMAVATGPESAAFRIKFDEQDWITVHPYSDKYGVWGFTNPYPSPGIKVRSIVIEHIGTSDGSGSTQVSDSVNEDEIIIIFSESTSIINVETEPDLAEPGDYLMVTQVGYIPPNWHNYSEEEVNPHLPWITRMGGTVNVGQ